MSAFLSLVGYPAGATAPICAAGSVGLPSRATMNTCPQPMFSPAHRNFMANSMKIVVESIEAKLSEHSLSAYRHIAIDSISHYIDAIVALEESGAAPDPLSGLHNQAEESIGAHFRKITEGMDSSDPAYQVLDALRYSFSCYAYNGLHQLYTRQENESWHPKLRLTEILKPNDIDSLDEELSIFRGCDIVELETSCYGQAWTTSPRVAHDFAFKHYRHQFWFDQSRRVVLQAECSKHDLLFSNQSGEFEVAVDVTRLRQVQRYA